MNGSVTSITGFTILCDKDDMSRKSSDVNKYNMGPEDLAAVIARAEKRYQEPQKRSNRYERIPVRKKKTKSSPVGGGKVEQIHSVLE